MCTIFSGAADGKVLVGNNEDFFDPFTHVWWVPREGARLDGRKFVAGELGRVYFGYTASPQFMQGGMNEAGLFFDYTAQTWQEMKKSAGKPRIEHDAMDEWMATCSTVDDVLARMDRVHCVGAERGCVFLADATGASAIYEGDETVWKQGRTLVGTNFRQSTTPPDEISCTRFQIASEMLGAGSEVSVPHFRRVLGAVHQEGAAKTVYSQVYDLVRRRIHLYHFHDFDHVAEYDLGAELEHGARSSPIADLFPRKHAFDEFARLIRFGAERDDLAAGLRADGTIVDPPPTTDPWTRYLGRFQADGMPEVICEVVLAGHRLVWLVTEGRPERTWLELHPTGESSFVGLQSVGNALYTFATDRVTVESGGFTIPFTRVA